MTVHLWHPWRHARYRHPNVTIECGHRLDGVMGEVDGNIVRLCRTLTQAERRCTVTHELIHIERRGREHPDPAVEELIVERETARRLIQLAQLIDAFQWFRHPALVDLAEELWVDQTTALCRLENLTPIEVAEIEHACDGEWSFEWRSA